MFYTEEKNEALEKLQKAAAEYKTAFDNTIYASCQLYEARKKTLDLIKSGVEFFDGISNIPDGLNDNVGKARSNVEIFEANIKAVQVELNKASASDTTIDGTNEGIELAIGGAAVGISVAVGGSAVAMAIATTFGIASTGVAISSLSGAAATTAALAWLGGGAVAAGGAGIAGGTALLAVFGPIGLGLAAIALTTGGFVFSEKNKKVAIDASGKIAELKRTTEKLRESIAKINGLYNETVQSEMKIRYLFDGLLSEDKNFSDWKNDSQVKFVDFAKETEILSLLLLKTLPQIEPETAARFILQQKGVFVAKACIEYSPDAGQSTEKTAYSKDLLVGHEVEIDPANFHIPEGSYIRLYVKVVAGKNNCDEKWFKYKHGGETIIYEIAGTTAINYIKKVSGQN